MGAVLSGNQLGNLKKQPKVPSRGGRGLGDDRPRSGVVGETSELDARCEMTDRSGNR